MTPLLQETFSSPCHSSTAAASPHTKGLDGKEKRGAVLSLCPNKQKENEGCCVLQEYLRVSLTLEDCSSLLPSKPARQQANSRWDARDTYLPFYHHLQYHKKMAHGPPLVNPRGCDFLFMFWLSLFFLLANLSSFSPASSAFLVSVPEASFMQDSLTPSFCQYMPISWEQWRYFL